MTKNGTSATSPTPHVAHLALDDVPGRGGRFLGNAVVAREQVERAARQDRERRPGVERRARDRADAAVPAARHDDAAALDGEARRALGGGRQLVRRVAHRDVELGPRVAGDLAQRIDALVERQVAGTGGGDGEQRRCGHEGAPAPRPARDAAHGRGGMDHAARPPAARRTVQFRAPARRWPTLAVMDILEAFLRGEHAGEIMIALGALLVLVGTARILRSSLTLAFWVLLCALGTASVSYGMKRSELELPAAARRRDARGGPVRGRQGAVGRRAEGAVRTARGTTGRAERIAHRAGPVTTSAGSSTPAEGTRSGPAVRCVARSGGTRLTASAPCVEVETFPTTRNTTVNRSSSYALGRRRPRRLGRVRRPRRRRSHHRHELGELSGGALEDRRGGTVRARRRARRGALHERRAEQQQPAGVRHRGGSCRAASTC